MMSDCTPLHFFLEHFSLALFFNSTRFYLLECILLGPLDVCHSLKSTSFTFRFSEHFRIGLYFGMALLLVIRTR
jgi:hypothetical protein